MRKIWWGVIPAILFFSVLMLAGCQRHASAPGKSPPLLVDGSSTVFPIAETVAARFMGLHPGTDIRVAISGTSGGIGKLCEGQTAVASASRPIRREEAENCRRRKVAFMELPIAFDGVAIVVHPRNDWASDITVSELKHMWAASTQTTVRYWSDVRPSWPQRELHLHGPDTASGTYDYFVEAIATGNLRTDYSKSADDNVTVASVATDELAIGFFGFAYWSENKDRLKLLAVDDAIVGNGEGPIRPSRESIQDGTYQPLSRPLFLYASMTALGKNGTEDFLSYFLQVVPSAAEEAGYIGLPADVYAALRQRFSQRRAGSVLQNRASSVGLSARELVRD